MDEYRPKIEVRRDERGLNYTRPHALYVSGSHVWWLTPAEATAWEQYAADAEVGARVRHADGDGVGKALDCITETHQFVKVGRSRDGGWFAVAEADGDLGIVGVRSADWPTPGDALLGLADMIAPQVNATPAPALPAGMVELDGEILCRGIDIPEGWDFYGPPETIGADEDDSRPWWDWRDRETDVRTGNAWYVVRRKVVPPAPRTVDVPWLEALRDQREVQRDHPIRVCEMVNGEPRLSWVGGYTDGDWWGGAVRINPDGTVTVLADRADDTTAPSGDQS